MPGFGEVTSGPERTLRGSQLKLSGLAEPTAACVKVPWIASSDTWLRDLAAVTRKALRTVPAAIAKRWSRGLEIRPMTQMPPWGGSQLTSEGHD